MIIDVRFKGTGEAFSLWMDAEPQPGPNHHSFCTDERGGLRAEADKAAGPESPFPPSRELIFSPAIVPAGYPGGEGRDLAGMIPDSEGFAYRSYRRPRVLCPLQIGCHANFRPVPNAGKLHAMEPE